MAAPRLLSRGKQVSCGSRGSPCMGAESSSKDAGAVRRGRWRCYGSVRVGRSTARTCSQPPGSGKAWRCSALAEGPASYSAPVRKSARHIAVTLPKHSSYSWSATRRRAGSRWRVAVARRVDVRGARAATRTVLDANREDVIAYRRARRRGERREELGGRRAPCLHRRLGLAAGAAERLKARRHAHEQRGGVERGVVGVEPRLCAPEQRNIPHALQPPRHASTCHALWEQP